MAQSKEIKMDMTAVNPQLYDFADGILLDRYIHPAEHVQGLKSMSLHKDDIFVTGYPKSGNVWLITTVSAIMSANDLDKFEQEGTGGIRRPIENVLVWDQIQKVPRPTVFMSHMRYSMLPDDVTKHNIKTIHISRNVKDVAVSMFHYIKMFKMTSTEVIKNIKWDVFLDGFLSGKKLPYGTWFDYMRDWLKQKENPNVLFVQYEDFVADPKEMIARLAKFMNKKISDDNIQRICQLVSIKSMQKNPHLDFVQHEVLDDSQGRFIRKGIVGDWKNFFSTEQSKLFDSIYEKLSLDTGFTVKFEL